VNKTAKPITSSTVVDSEQKVQLTRRAESPALKLQSDEALAQITKNAQANFDPCHPQVKLVMNGHSRLRRRLA
jgi:hypothetical protein